ncbi:hypothetical protein GC098_12800 [Paenibacillus sp. LMG 31458]|uniref:LPXTG cell wall anchor domain-containing protein n=1 Tax=Paenibacillus phytorum TaxID=2654977 RepID=A0ABX1XWW6_9BACL|nr:hypothetical protein [Paenibacillus phytorum]NOU72293.1 hypothetical protein [Paenibacillus phytorum]
MKRWLLAGLTFVLAALIILPSSALAYSYGDANTEAVAETFKLVQTSIGDGADNWGAAEGAYKEIRAELVSHFGEGIAATLDANFQAKDSKAVIANFKAVLVMNLDRRFTYAVKGIDDYAESKLLLAKAKATFDTLEPYVGAGSSEINKAFETALEALGNPGLFGVGKKDVQPDVFKEKVNFIYGKVKPLFPYKAYVKPAASSEPTSVPKPQATTAPVKNETGAKAEQPVSPVKDAKPTETKSPDAAAAVETKSPEPTATASASPAATTEAAQPSATVEAPAKASEAAGSDTKQADSVKEASAHAPMERSDKTNPFVSVAVIGGVIVLLGGGVWFARKRKWI